MNDYQDLGALLDEAGRGQPSDNWDAGMPTAPIGPPFHDFDVADWCAFSGCCSDNPQVCDSIEGLVIVVDSAAITAVHFEGAAVDVYARQYASGPATASACARALVGALGETGADGFTEVLEKFLGAKTGGL